MEVLLIDSNRVVTVFCNTEDAGATPSIMNLGLIGPIVVMMVSMREVSSSSLTWWKASVMSISPKNSHSPALYNSSRITGVNA